MIQNKAPGKDVSIEDMKEKFPLTAKKINHIILHLKFLELHLGANCSLLWLVLTWWRMRI